MLETWVMLNMPMMLAECLEKIMQLTELLAEESQN